MQIIPAIDLKEGRCVRLSQGRKDAASVYHSDPALVARKFADSGASMIHIVDLDAAFGENGSANLNALKQILDTISVPVEFGGGVRTAEQVRELTELGVDRIILGTVAVESPEALKDFVAEFNSGIAVGIDARDGKVLTRGWQETTTVTALELARTVAAAGVGRLIYTDTFRDGMLTGPNIQQTVAVARASQIHVTASGGMASLDDIRRLRDADEPLIDSVIIGKALYEQKFTLEDALRIAHS